MFIVRVTDLQIWRIGTKEVNRLQYDFLLARYLKCPKMVDGPLHHFAKCHFGGLFKYGRRYVSKMVKFRKISMTRLTCQPANGLKLFL